MGDRNLVGSLLCPDASAVLEIQSGSSELLADVFVLGIFLVFVVTQRIGMIVERTDLLGGTVIRLLILVPIYIYGVASGARE